MTRGGNPEASQKWIRVETSRTSCAGTGNATRATEAPPASRDVISRKHSYSAKDNVFLLNKVEEFPVSTRDVMCLVENQNKVFSLLYSNRGEAGELMLVPFNIEAGCYDKPVYQQPIKDTISKAVVSGQFLVYACENAHKNYDIKIISLQTMAEIAVIPNAHQKSITGLYLILDKGGSGPLLFSASLDQKLKVWRLNEATKQMALYEDLYKYICSKISPTQLYFLKAVTQGGHEFLLLGGNQGRLIQWDLTLEFAYYEYAIKAHDNYRHVPTKIYELVPFKVNFKGEWVQLVAVNSWDQRSSGIFVVNPSTKWQQPDPLLVAHDDRQKRRFTEMAFIGNSLVVGALSGEVAFFQLAITQGGLRANKYALLQLSNIVRQLSLASVKFSTDVECHLLFVHEQFGEKDSRMKGKGSLSVWNLK